MRFNWKALLLSLHCYNRYTLTAIDIYDVLRVESICGYNSCHSNDITFVDTYKFRDARCFRFPQSHEEHRRRHGHRVDAPTARCCLQHFIDHRPQGGGAPTVKFHPFRNLMNSPSLKI